MQTTGRISSEAGDGVVVHPCLTEIPVARTGADRGDDARDRTATGCVERIGAAAMDRGRRANRLWAEPARDDRVPMDGQRLDANRSYLAGVPNRSNRPIAVCANSPRSVLSDEMGGNGGLRWYFVWCPQMLLFVGASVKPTGKMRLDCGRFGFPNVRRGFGAPRHSPPRSPRQSGCQLKLIS